MFRLVLSFIILFFLGACVTTEHKYMRGTVVMKIDSKTAHVCLGEKEVKAGDKVDFINYDCEGDIIDTSGLAGTCVNKTVGEGVVEKTLGTHYSIVKTEGGFNFKEGTLIQKK